jgi:hypothetical protein
MLEGDDPIAKIQFNQLINGTGARNQAMLQGLGMKLKQNNLDGQGAGDALLEMMARDSEFDVGQLRAKISEDSAKRLYDLNTWGFEKANDIAKEQEKQKRDDLSNFISTGQIEAAKGAFEDLFPGIPFDEHAIKAADPARTANFNARMKVVDQFVAQGNAVSAKEAFLQIAKEMPEMFGFSDPETAIAALSNVDFATDAWQTNLKISNDADVAARTAALQGDDSAVNAALDMKFSRMLPASIEALAKAAAKRPLSEINDILAAAGMAPVSSTDEAATLDKTAFAKAAAAYDLKKDAVKEAPDRLFDIFAKANPAIAIDPEASRYAKAYLGSAAYQLATSEDGTVSLGSFDGKGQIPPWDPKSEQAPLFMDWPHATFNPDGTKNEVIYEGLKPYDKDYKPGDLTTAKGKEDARLDKAYKDYAFSTPAGDRLDMEKWYYATAGGTKPVNVATLPASLTPDKKPEDFKPSDTTDQATGVRTVTSLDPVTGETKTETIQPLNLAAEVDNIGGSGKSFQAWLVKNPTGLVAIPGGVGKVTGIEDTHTSKWGHAIAVEVNGKKYWYNVQRGVFTDPKQTVLYPSSVSPIDPITGKAK